MDTGNKTETIQKDRGFKASVLSCEILNYGSGIKEISAVFRYRTFRLRIVKDCVIFSVGFKIGGELIRVPLSHVEIVHQIISAVDRSGTRHFLCLFD